MRLRYCIQCFFTLLILLLGVLSASGQTKQIMVWRDALDQIQALSATEMAAEKENLARIRDGVEFWIRAHPGATVTLASVAASPADETRQLREAVALIIKEDKGQAFYLGETSVTVTAEVSPLSPVTDSVSYTEIEELNATSVSDALQYLPGLSLDKSGSRNQTGIMIRGFNTSQVGVYLDNIPVLVPYDGYADIGRFMAADIASIDVAKGYSSPLLGPNGLGGAINLVTRQPEKQFEGDMTLGTGSGEMLEAGIHLGSRLDKFFFRVGMDWLQSSYFPLSGDFTPIGVQAVAAGNTLGHDRERVNSDKRDVRYNGRVGWTPREGDQYVFTYTKQKADHGVPPYTGNMGTNPRYWRWGYWNRDSYYLNTTTALGQSSSIKFRAFLDYYPNMLNMFSDATFSAPHPRQGAWSKYDDHSEGFAVEFNTRLVPKNDLSASFFLKGDTHKTQDPGEPWAKSREYVTSIGLQDAIAITTKLRATLGLSIDHLDSTWAQDLVDIEINGEDVPTLVPFTCSDRASNGFSDCLLHQWTANPLASVSYAVGETGTLFFTFAQKSHFPTMKDRYSDKAGIGIQNPNLRPEHSNNYSLGYMHSFAFNTQAQIEFFRSDVSDAIESQDIPWAYDDQCPENNGFCSQTVNVGEALNQGIELTLRTSPARRFILNTNYTYLMRKIYDMPTVLPTASPKHRLVAVANYQLPSDILLTATARYEAGAITAFLPKGSNIPLAVPASKFATMDLGGTFPVYRGAKLQLGVKNLFDRNYYYEEGFPEPGRTWYANMKYSF